MSTLHSNASSETWKDVAGYEGHYEVSNRGRVRSVKANCILRTFDNGRGYDLVTLSKGSRRRHHRVHRLVASHFLAPKEGRKFVNHKDFNKKNNDINNLEWLTHYENMVHAYRGGRMQVDARPQSGVPGVTYETKIKKWRVRLSIDGDNFELGTFETCIEAIGVRTKAATAHGRPDIVEFAS